ncbi:MAG: NAD(P)/FAD-dependent oxidoreductase [Pseudomonadota bacterium]
MLERTTPNTADIDAVAIARDWLAEFVEAMTGPAEAMAALFTADCHWRDLVALTGALRTTSGTDGVTALHTALAERGATGFAIDTLRLPPAETERAGHDVIEALYTFRTPLGPCEGLIRLRLDGGDYKAWTLNTAQASLDGFEKKPAQVYAKDVRAPNWLDHRMAARAYADRDPAVLVVGGGHAGLSIAAYLGSMGIDTLVVDREKRIGDNWRLRYHNLALHNQIGVNHMPFMPFPPTYPRYIPKDQVANWLEIYAEAMEINFWLETSFDGAEWDEESQVWSARVTRNGETRTMRPRHIVMACSTSAVPKRPDIESLSAFDGVKQHSEEFEIGSEWAGRPVMVLGTGTSSHDICQHLHAHGAHVTMVQRSPTMVVNVEPTAQRYDGLYLGDGPPVAVRDLVNISFPLDLIKRSHQILTRQVRDDEAEFYGKLSDTGFRLSWGEDDMGWPMLYRTRGGGYYFNIGASELIIEREIDLIQYHDIDRFVADGVQMSDGTHRPADLVVMSTGYENQGALVRKLFGDAVADRAGQVWGFNDAQEMANMWTRTGQPGLWFTAGAFSQCRIYSKFLAQQIALDL